MPRQDIRFAVVEGERALSSVWVAWRNKRDVYVAIRTIATKFKTSLHRSGTFRHAFVTDAESERFQRPGSDRAIAKWPRPSEQAVGATLLLQIIIPGIELTGKILKYPLPPNLVQLDRPNESQVVYVSFIETSPGTSTAGPTMAEGPTRTLARWQTEEGGVVWIVSHIGALSAGNRAFIRQRHDRVRAAMEAANPAVIHVAPGDDPSELRSFLLMRPSSDGVGQIMDINLEFLRREFPLVPEVTDADIRTRAYFLWENRTGRGWTNAESNWLEAKAIERLRAG